MVEGLVALVVVHRCAITSTGDHFEDGLRVALSLLTLRAGLVRTRRHVTAALCSANEQAVSIGCQPSPVTASREPDLRAAERERSDSRPVYHARLRTEPSATG